MNKRISPVQYRIISESHGHPYPIGTIVENKKEPNWPEAIRPNRDHVVYCGRPESTIGYYLWPDEIELTRPSI